MSAQEPPQVITTYEETSYPEGPSASGIFTSDIIALPQYIWWIQLSLSVVAAVFAWGIFVRERSWSAAMMGLACCCFAVNGVPLLLSVLFPNSENIQRICLNASLPLMYVQMLGTPLLAASLFLRWRSARR
jgi:hypothetical protein